MNTFCIAVTSRLTRNHRGGASRRTSCNLVALTPRICFRGHSAESSTSAIRHNLRSASNTRREDHELWEKTDLGPNPSSSLARDLGQ